MLCFIKRKNYLIYKGCRSIFYEIIKKGELQNMGYLVYMGNMWPGGADVFDILFHWFKMRLKSAAPPGMPGNRAVWGLQIQRFNIR